MDRMCSIFSAIQIWFPGNLMLCTLWTWPLLQTMGMHCPLWNQVFTSSFINCINLSQTGCTIPWVAKCSFQFIQIALSSPPALIHALTLKQCSVQSIHSFSSSSTSSFSLTNKSMHHFPAKKVNICNVAVSIPQSVVLYSSICHKYMQCIYIQFAMRVLA